MVVTFIVRLLMGLIWLIALLVATIVALPVLAVFGCLFLVWKILASLGAGFSGAHRKDLGMLEL